MSPDNRFPPDPPGLGRAAVALPVGPHGRALPPIGPRAMGPPIMPPPGAVACAAVAPVAPAVAANGSTPAVVAGAGGDDDGAVMPLMPPTPLDGVPPPIVCTGRWLSAAPLEPPGESNTENSISVEVRRSLVFGTGDAPPVAAAAALGVAPAGVVWRATGAAWQRRRRVSTLRRRAGATPACTYRCAGGRRGRGCASLTRRAVLGIRSGRCGPARGGAGRRRAWRFARRRRRRRRCGLRVRAAAVPPRTERQPRHFAPDFGADGGRGVGLVRHVHPHCGDARELRAAGAAARANSPKPFASACLKRK